MTGTKTKTANSSSVRETSTQAPSSDWRAVERGDTKLNAMRRLLHPKNDEKRRRWFGLFFSAALALALSPAQAAEILRQSPGLSNHTNRPPPVERREPQTARTGSTKPTLGPWEFPADRPRRNLDGTLTDDPRRVIVAVPRVIRRFSR